MPQERPLPLQQGSKQQAARKPQTPQLPELRVVPLGLAQPAPEEQGAVAAQPPRLFSAE
jgi:hypothetical protein